MRLKRIEKEIIKEPFSQSQDDIDADHYHDVGDLIISTDQSYYVEDILYRKVGKRRELKHLSTCRKIKQQ